MAPDWETLPNGVEYSPSKQLWYFKGMVYDERSARHNGLIGAGADLKRMIEEGNEDD